MKNDLFDDFIIYLCSYLIIIIACFIFGLLIYYICLTDKKEQIIKKSKNNEIIKVIKTMKNDLIINIDKYSFIEINDIINIIKNNYEYNDNIDDINNFMENKRQDIIKEVKIKLRINYKNDLINKIIMEKNLLNTTLTITDLRSIKEKLENHKKEINYLFELVNEINIRISNN